MTDERHKALERRVADDVKDRKPGTRTCEDQRALGCVGCGWLEYEPTRWSL